MKDKKNENELNEARRKYYENWRKINKDKVKKHNKTFWEKKAKEFEKRKEDTL